MKKFCLITVLFLSYPFLVWQPLKGMDGGDPFEFSSENPNDNPNDNLDDNHGNPDRLDSILKTEGGLKNRRTVTFSDPSLGGNGAGDGDGLTIQAGDNPVTIIDQRDQPIITDAMAQNIEGLLDRSGNNSIKPENNDPKRHRAVRNPNQSDPENKPSLVSPDVEKTIDTFDDWVNKNNTNEGGKDYIEKWMKELKPEWIKQYKKAIVDLPQPHEDPEKAFERVRFRLEEDLIEKATFKRGQLVELFDQLGLGDADFTTNDPEKLEDLLGTLHKAISDLSKSDGTGWVEIKNKTPEKGETVIRKKRFSLDNGLQKEMLLDFLNEKLGTITEKVVETTTQSKLSGIETDLDNIETDEINEVLDALKKSSVEIINISMIEPISKTLTAYRKKLTNLKGDLKRFMRSDKQAEEKENFLKTITELQDKITKLDAQLPSTESMQSMKAFNKLTSKITTALLNHESGEFSLSFNSADLAELQKMVTWECVSGDGKTMFDGLTDFIRNKAQKLLNQVVKDPNFLKKVKDLDFNALKLKAETMLNATSGTYSMSDIEDLQEEMNNLLSRMNRRSKFFTFSMKTEQQEFITQMNQAMNKVMQPFNNPDIARRFPNVVKPKTVSGRLKSLWNRALDSLFGKGRQTITPVEIEKATAQWKETTNTVLENAEKSLQKAILDNSVLSPNLIKSITTLTSEADSLRAQTSSPLESQALLDTLSAQFEKAQRLQPMVEFVSMTPDGKLKTFLEDPKTYLTTAVDVALEGYSALNAEAVSGTMSLAELKQKATVFNEAQNTVTLRLQRSDLPDFNTMRQMIIEKFSITIQNNGSVPEEIISQVMNTPIDQAGITLKGESDTENSVEVQQLREISMLFQSPILRPLVKLILANDQARFEDTFTTIQDAIENPDLASLKQKLMETLMQDGGPVERFKTIESELKKNR